MKIRAGIVVGEPSGDALAAPMIAELSRIYTDSIFAGIAGPKLLAEGVKTIAPMDRLSLMGFFEPLKRLPELYRLRKNLIQLFTHSSEIYPSSKPDVFIGVDAPDFNLGLERILREKGIPTVHYVSPTVWAWRQGRIHGIKRAVDLMLVLYPFEAEFYQKHKVPVCFTGHPFADQIALEINTASAKEALGYSAGQTIVAILPGSRQSEIQHLAATYIKAAQWCYERDKSLVFLAPLVNTSHRVQFEALCMQLAPDVPIQTLEGNARGVMAACDIALVTSGTATLEVALHKKPMVVAYRVGPITYQIAKRLIKVPYISQPNLLAGELLVPELIQNNATPERLGEELLAWLSPAYSAARDRLHSRFTELHETLRRNASVTAANAIVSLIK